MALSETKKKANKKYNDSKTHLVGLRLVNKEYSLLQEYAKKNSLTPSGVIRDRIKDIIHPNSDDLTEDHINPPDLTEDRINPTPGNTENS